MKERTFYFILTIVGIILIIAAIVLPKDWLVVTPLNISEKVPLYRSLNADGSYNGSIYIYNGSDYLPVACNISGCLVG